MPNPNGNCLEGMRCPACGSYGPFHIEAECCVTVWDSGTEDYGGCEWGNGSACRCSCGVLKTIQVMGRAVVAAPPASWREAN
jgi:hypothetical protein